eukprot:scaffold32461_cov101-Isochrysis_galbana.AAC.2
MPRRGWAAPSRRALLPVLPIARAVFRSACSDASSTAGGSSLAAPAQRAGRRHRRDDRGPRPVPSEPAPAGGPQRGRAGVGRPVTGAPAPAGPSCRHASSGGR